jgi:hypothetical protein
MAKKQSLSEYSWNGVPLYDGEAFGSFRAHYQTVVNGTHTWFKIVVPPCHDFCQEREVESIYVAAGTQDQEYPLTRLQAIKELTHHGLTEKEKVQLAIVEITPEIAKLCLASEIPVFPHIDGVY